MIYRKYKNILLDKNDIKNNTKEHLPRKFLLFILELFIYILAFVGAISLLYPEIRLHLFRVLYEAYREFILLCR